MKPLFCALAALQLLSTTALAQVRRGAPVDPRRVPNPTQPVNVRTGGALAQRITLLPDLVVNGIRHNLAEHSIDVMIRNQGGVPAGECQVRLEALNGTTVTKQVLLTLPATPPGTNQVLNFPTNGWTAQAAAATAFRVVANSNLAYNEATLVNNTLSTLPATPPPTSGGVFLPASSAADLIIGSVQRVPGQNALRIRISNQGPATEAGNPVVTVYALAPWHSVHPGAFAPPGAATDTVHMTVFRAPGSITEAWATSQATAQGMAAHAWREVVVQMPAVPVPGAKQPGSSWPNAGPVYTSGPKSFGTAAFYIVVSSSMDMVTDNNSAFVAPVGG